MSRVSTGDLAMVIQATCDFQSFVGKVFTVGPFTPNLMVAGEMFHDYWQLTADYDIMWVDPLGWNRLLPAGSPVYCKDSSLIRINGPQLEIDTNREVDKEKETTC